MKILIVNGESHKGTTWHIARQVAEKAAAAVPGSTIDEIWLPAELPSFCLGCAQCVCGAGELKCPHAAYTAPLAAKLDAADVLIFESPVYVYHCTGAMKNFLDHFAYRWMIHRPSGAMFTKQAVVISTAAGAGMGKTCTDMADSLRWWGVPRIYRCGMAVTAVGWNHVADKKKRAIDRASSRLAAKLVRGCGRVKPGLRTLALFALFRAVQKKGIIPMDSSYWKANGWLGKERPWKASGVKQMPDADGKPGAEKVI